ncbi:TBC1 domain, member 5 [Perkinsus olseni]|uniref:TBC1 domain, member 5 n=4 Tax=Perkinsus olseni TaxID=32597 RepID=A0A7J6PHB0_PEROL|nr:TBC1 domain, member 5 [Perkinsus olseni]
MLRSEGSGNPLSFLGVDDDVYTREAKADMKEAAIAVLRGDKDIAKLRAFYWPRFLRTVVEASDCEGNRKHYRALSSKHQPKSGGLLARQFKGMDPNVCNPLSKASENPWNKEHKNTDILNEIWVDVSRTNYSNREWFKVEDNQKSMQRILYVWCKERNKDYRQGMSDIATVLLYGLVGDESGNCIGPQGPADGEADAFMLYDAIMSGKIRHSDMFYSEPSGANSIPSPAAPSSLASKSKILERCEYVFDQLLPQADEELSNHLHNSAKVAPSLFLMRWIRLLFAREMHVVEVLRLWDMIFADSYLHWTATEEMSLPLVNYMAVSMILQVRGTLMSGDNTACLQRLMRYPPVDHVEPLVGRALRLRDGEKALRPRIVSEADGGADSSVREVIEKKKAVEASENEPIQSSATDATRDRPAGEPLQRQPQMDPLRGDHSSLSSLFGTVVHSAVDAFSTAITEGRAVPQSYTQVEPKEGAPKLREANRPAATVTPPEQIHMPRDLADSWDDEVGGEDETSAGHGSNCDDGGSTITVQVSSVQLEKWQRSLDSAIAAMGNPDPRVRDGAVDVLRDISASIGQARKQPSVDRLK